MSNNQFTGTAMQLQRNRKFCQFNNDQYCTPYIYPQKQLIFLKEILSTDTRQNHLVPKEAERSFEIYLGQMTLAR